MASTSELLSEKCVGPMRMDAKSASPEIHDVRAGTTSQLRASATGANIATTAGTRNHLPQLVDVARIAPKGRHGAQQKPRREAGVYSGVTRRQLWTLAGRR